MAENQKTENTENIQTTNRILIIDILRGLTLFGVVTVNAATINGPYFLDTIDFAFKHNWLDQAIASLLSIFFLEKFYPIFVFLFGVSNYLFISGLINKYKKIYSTNNFIRNRQIDNKYIHSTVVKIFSKRMFILGLIGFLHLSLFFWGDVLLVYALLGILLILILNYIVNYNQKKLLCLNLLLVITTIVINLCIFKLISLDADHASFDEHFNSIVIDSDDNIPDTIAVYHNGSLLNIIKKNLESYYNIFFYGTFNYFESFDFIIFLDNLNYFIELLILMLLGSSLAMTPNWYEKALSISNSNLVKITSILICCFIVSEYLHLYQYSFMDYCEIITILNNVFLYLVTFLWVFKTIFYQDNKNYNQILQRFAAVGRMTLTWYLLLSVSMSVILYNYGFSLYGKIGVSGCFLFAVLYYILCYSVSHLWLAKFQQGPIEKLWRKLTVPELPSQPVLSEK